MFLKMEKKSRLCIHNSRRQAFKSFETFPNILIKPAGQKQTYDYKF